VKRLLVATAAFAVATAAVASPAHAAVSTATAKKLSKAGVLTKSDLKGYTTSAQQETASDEKIEAALYKCLGVKVPKYVTRNFGTAFTSADGALEIDSNADVAKSAAAGQSDVKALKLSRAPGCVKKYFQASIAEAGGSFSSLSVKLVKVSVSGADAVAAFHVVGAAGPIKLNGYQLAVLAGQTEINVSPVRYDGKDPGLKQATALAKTVVKRVKAVH
jgi:hypothetical protein